MDSSGGAGLVATAKVSQPAFLVRQFSLQADEAISPAWLESN